MKNSCLNEWKQNGNVYLWLYNNRSKRGNWGLNITFDGRGFESFKRLAECLLISDGGHRTVRLSDPTQQFLPGSCSSVECHWFSKLRIQFDSNSLGTAFVVSNKDELTMSVGKFGILALITALAKWERNEYDFSIPCEIHGAKDYDRSLWFW